jgi:hypothetical protein
MSEAKSLDLPPVPATLAQLIAQRKRPIIRSLNDEVEQIHLSLWEDDEEGERYRTLLSPIWRTQCLEGSFLMDDSELARLIRDYAKDNRMPIAANTNLASIVHSLNVVRKRYRLDRRYRQNLVGDEFVDWPGSGDGHAHRAEATD